MTWHGAAVAVGASLIAVSVTGSVFYLRFFRPYCGLLPAFVGLADTMFKGLIALVKQEIFVKGVNFSSYFQAFSADLAGEIQFDPHITEVPGGIALCDTPPRDWWHLG
ncbi:MAG: hypothetical protein AAF556_08460 [Pseudomonadota bacterium]